MTGGADGHGNLEADDAPAWRPLPSRRQMLISAAAAGVVAWAAPQITSIADAQTVCGSPFPCTATERSWTVGPFGAPDGNLNGSDLTANGAGASWVVGGTTLTVNRTPASNANLWHTITNTAGGATQTTGVVKNATTGNNAPFVPICRRERLSGDAAGSSGSSAITFAFNPGVTKLSFTLLDIDGSGILTTDIPTCGAGVTSNSTVVGTVYKEQVVLTWTVAAGDPAVTPGYTPGTGLANTGANSYAVNTALTNLGGTNFPAGDPYNAVQTTNVCNLGVDFGGCSRITSLTITSNDCVGRAGTDNTGAGRNVGVSNLSWCVP